MKKSLLKKALLLTITIVYFSTNVVLGALSEAKMWSDRRKAIEVTSLPAVAPISQAVLPKTIALNESLSPNLKPAPKNSDIQNILATIPQNVGSVQEVFEAKVRSSDTSVREVRNHLGTSGANKISDFPNLSSNRTVVLLQDIHLNVEAQTNLSAILQQLIDQRQIGTVGIEAAFGQFDFQEFRTHPRQDVVKQVAREFFEKGDLAAPSFVGVTSAVEPPAYLGVDDEISYGANVEAYRMSIKLKPAVMKRIQDYEKELALRKEKVFSPKLKAFDALRSGHTREAIGLGKYVSQLAEYDVEKDFVIAQFLEAYGTEQRLDLKRVDVERKTVIEELTKKLNEAELSNVMSQSLAYRTGNLGFARYYENLKTLCESKGISLRKAPAFDNYIRYVMLADGIKADKFFTAVSDMEIKVGEQLVETQQQRDLLLESERLSLTKKLVEFSLTAKEWEEYKVRKVRGVRQVRNDFRHGEANKISDIPDLSDFLGHFERFYEEADIRSHKMVANLFDTKKVRKGDEAAREVRQVRDNLGVNGANKISDLSHYFRTSRTSVLIVGGFHTSQITQLLREQNISYVVVSPKIAKIDSATGTAYLSEFTKQKSPLDKLFAGEKLFLGLTRVNLADYDEREKFKFVIDHRSNPSAWPEWLRGAVHSLRLTFQPAGNGMASLRSPSMSLLALASIAITCFAALPLKYSALILPLIYMVGVALNVDDAPSSVQKRQFTQTRRDLFRLISMEDLRQGAIGSDFNGSLGPVGKNGFIKLNYNQYQDLLNVGPAYTGWDASVSDVFIREKFLEFKITLRKGKVSEEIIFQSTPGEKLIHHAPDRTRTMRMRIMSDHAALPVISRLMTRTEEMSESELVELLTTLAGLNAGRTSVMGAINFSPRTNYPFSWAALGRNEGGWLLKIIKVRRVADSIELQGVFTKQGRIKEAITTYIGPFKQKISRRTDALPNPNEPETIDVFKIEKFPAKTGLLQIVTNGTRSWHSFFANFPDLRELPIDLLDLAGRTLLTVAPHFHTYLQLAPRNGPTSNKDPKLHWRTRLLDIGRIGRLVFASIGLTRLDQHEVLHLFVGPSVKSIKGIGPRQDDETTIWQLDSHPGLSLLRKVVAKPDSVSWETFLQAYFTLTELKIGKTDAAGRIVFHINKIPYHINTDRAEHGWNVSILKIGLSWSYPNLAVRFIRNGIIRYQIWRIGPKKDSHGRYVTHIAEDFDERVFNDRLRDLFVATHGIARADRQRLNARKRVAVTFMRDLAKSPLKSFVPQSALAAQLPSTSEPWAQAASWETMFVSENPATFSSDVQKVIGSFKSYDQNSLSAFRRYVTWESDRNKMRELCLGMKNILMMEAKSINDIRLIHLSLVALQSIPETFEKQNPLLMLELAQVALPLAAFLSGHAEEDNRVRHSANAYLNSLPTNPMLDILRQRPKSESIYESHVPGLKPASIFHKRLRSYSRRELTMGETANTQKSASDRQASNDHPRNNLNSPNALLPLLFGFGIYFANHTPLMIGIGLAIVFLSLAWLYVDMNGGFQLMTNNGMRVIIGLVSLIFFYNVVDQTPSPPSQSSLLTDDEFRMVWAMVWSLEGRHNEARLILSGDPSIPDVPQDDILIRYLAYKSRFAREGETLFRNWRTEFLFEHLSLDLKRKFFVLTGGSGEDKDTIAEPVTSTLAGKEPALKNAYVNQVPRWLRKSNSQLSEAEVLYISALYAISTGSELESLQQRIDKVVKAIIDGKLNVHLPVDPINWFVSNKASFNGMQEKFGASLKQMAPGWWYWFFGANDSAAATLQKRGIKISIKAVSTGDPIKDFRVWIKKHRNADYMGLIIRCIVSGSLDLLSLPLEQELSDEELGAYLNLIKNPKASLKQARDFYDKELTDGMLGETYFYPRKFLISRTPLVPWNQLVAHSIVMKGGLRFLSSDIRELINHAEQSLSEFVTDSSQKNKGFGSVLLVVSVLVAAIAFFAMPVKVAALVVPMALMVGMAFYLNDMGDGAGGTQAPKKPSRHLPVIELVGVNREIAQAEVFFKVLMESHIKSLMAGSMIRKAKTDKERDGAEKEMADILKRLEKFQKSIVTPALRRGRVDLRKQLDQRLAEAVEFFRNKNYLAGQNTLLGAAKIAEEEISALSEKKFGRARVHMEAKGKFYWAPVKKLYQLIQGKRKNVIVNDTEVSVKSIGPIPFELMADAYHEADNQVDDELDYNQDLEFAQQKLREILTDMQQAKESLSADHPELDVDVAKSFEKRFSELYHLWRKPKYIKQLQLAKLCFHAARMQILLGDVNATIITARLAIRLLEVRRKSVRAMVDYIEAVRLEQMRSQSRDRNTQLREKLMIMKNAEGKFRPFEVRDAKAWLLHRLDGSNEPDLNGLYDTINQDPNIDTAIEIINRSDQVFNFMVNFRTEYKQRRLAGELEADAKEHAFISAWKHFAGQNSAVLSANPILWHSWLIALGTQAFIPFRLPKKDDSEKLGKRNPLFDAMSLFGELSRLNTAEAVRSSVALSLQRKRAGIFGIFNRHYGDDNAAAFSVEDRRLDRYHPGVLESQVIKYFEDREFRLTNGAIEAWVTKFYELAHSPVPIHVTKSEKKSNLAAKIVSLIILLFTLLPSWAQPATPSAPTVPSAPRVTGIFTSAPGTIVTNVAQRNQVIGLEIARLLFHASTNYNTQVRLAIEQTIENAKRGGSPIVDVPGILNRTALPIAIHIVQRYNQFIPGLLKSVTGNQLNFDIFFSELGTHMDSHQLVLLAYFPDNLYSGIRAKRMDVLFADKSSLSTNALNEVSDPTGIVPFRNVKVRPLSEAGVENMATLVPVRGKLKIYIDLDRHEKGLADDWDRLEALRHIPDAVIRANLTASPDDSSFVANWARSMTRASFSDAESLTGKEFSSAHSDDYLIDTIHHEEAHRDELLDLQFPPNTSDEIKAICAELVAELKALARSQNPHARLPHSVNWVNGPTVHGPAGRWIVQSFIRHINQNPQRFAADRTFTTTARGVRGYLWYFHALSAKQLTDLADLALTEAREKIKAGAVQGELTGAPGLPPLPVGVKEAEDLAHPPAPQPAPVKSSWVSTHKRIVGAVIAILIGIAASLKFKKKLPVLFVLGVLFVLLSQKMPFTFGSIVGLIGGVILVGILLNDSPWPDDFHHLGKEWVAYSASIKTPGGFERNRDKVADFFGALIDEFEGKASAKLIPSGEGRLNLFITWSDKKFVVSFVNDGNDTSRIIISAWNEGTYQELVPLISSLAEKSHLVSFVTELKFTPIQNEVVKQTSAHSQEKQITSVAQLQMPKAFQNDPIKIQDFFELLLSEFQKNWKCALTSGNDFTRIALTNENGSANVAGVYGAGPILNIGVYASDKQSHDDLLRVIATLAAKAQLIDNPFALQFQQTTEGEAASADLPNVEESWELFTAVVHTPETRDKTKLKMAEFFNALKTSFHGAALQKITPGRNTWILAMEWPGISAMVSFVFVSETTSRIIVSSSDKRVQRNLMLLIAAIATKVGFVSDPKELEFINVTSPEDSQASVPAKWVAEGKFRPAKTYNVSWQTILYTELVKQIELRRKDDLRAFHLTMEGLGNTLRVVGESETGNFNLVITRKENERMDIELQASDEKILTRVADAITKAILASRLSDEKNTPRYRTPPESGLLIAPFTVLLLTGLMILCSAASDPVLFIGILSLVSAPLTLLPSKKAAAFSLASGAAVALLAHLLWMTSAFVVGIAASVGLVAILLPDYSPAEQPSRPQKPLDRWVGKAILDYQSQGKSFRERADDFVENITEVLRFYPDAELVKIEVRHRSDYVELKIATGEKYQGSVSLVLSSKNSVTVAVAARSEKFYRHLLMVVTEATLACGLVKNSSLVRFVPDSAPAQKQIYSSSANSNQGPPERFAAKAFVPGIDVSNDQVLAKIKLFLANIASEASEFPGIAAGVVSFDSEFDQDFIISQFRIENVWLGSVRLDMNLENAVALHVNASSEENLEHLKNVIAGAAVKSKLLNERSALKFVHLKTDPKLILEMATVEPALNKIPLPNGTLISEAVASANLKAEYQSTSKWLETFAESFMSGLVLKQASLGEFQLKAVRGKKQLRIHGQGKKQQFWVAVSQEQPDRVIISVYATNLDVLRTICRVVHEVFAEGGYKTDSKVLFFSLRRHLSYFSSFASLGFIGLFPESSAKLFAMLSDSLNAAPSSMFFGVMLGVVISIALIGYLFAGSDADDPRDRWIGTADTNVVQTTPDITRKNIASYVSLIQVLGFEKEAGQSDLTVEADETKEGFELIFTAGSLYFGRVNIFVNPQNAVTFQVRAPTKQTYGYLANICQVAARQLSFIESGNALSFISIIEDGKKTRTPAETAKKVPAHILEIMASAPKNQDQQFSFEKSGESFISIFSGLMTTAISGEEILAAKIDRTDRTLEVVYTQKGRFVGKFVIENLHDSLVFTLGAAKQEGLIMMRPLCAMAADASGLITAKTQLIFAPKNPTSHFSADAAVLPFGLMGFVDDTFPIELSSFVSKMGNSIPNMWLLSAVVLSGVALVALIVGLTHSESRRRLNARTIFLLALITSGFLWLGTLLDWTFEQRAARGDGVGTRVALSDISESGLMRRSADQLAEIAVALMTRNVDGLLGPSATVGVGTKVIDVPSTGILLKNLDQWISDVRFKIIFRNALERKLGGKVHGSIAVERAQELTEVIVAVAFHQRTLAQLSRSPHDTHIFAFQGTDGKKGIQQQRIQMMAAILTAGLDARNIFLTDELSSPVLDQAIKSLQSFGFEVTSPLENNIAFFYHPTLPVLNVESPFFQNTLVVAPGSLIPDKAPDNFKPLEKFIPIKFLNLDKIVEFFRSYMVAA